VETVSLPKFIGVFFGAFLVDILWTLGIRRTSQGKALSSALLSSTLLVINGLVVLSYVNNAWYLLAGALGAFTGNYLTVKMDTRRP
jgi:hypothetical protein